MPVYLHTVSRTIELSLQSSFQLSLTVLVRYRTRVVFSLGWSVPPYSGCKLKQPYSTHSTIQQSTCSYGLYTLCEPLEPQSREHRTCQLPASKMLNTTFPTPLRAGFGAGLIPVHSPLLRESLLVSFPPLIDMLKFSG